MPVVETFILLSVLWRSIKKHSEYTDSETAVNKFLANWKAILPKFVRMMPCDYKRVLPAIKNAVDAGLSGDEAIDEAFESNALAVAQIGGD